jgi:hypothetical protein
MAPEAIAETARTIGTTLIHPFFPADPYDLKTPYTDIRLNRAVGRLNNSRLYDPGRALYPKDVDMDVEKRDNIILDMRDEGMLRKCWRESSFGDVVFFGKVALVVCFLVFGIPVALWYVLR